MDVSDHNAYNNVTSTPGSCWPESSIPKLGGGPSQHHLHKRFCRRRLYQRAEGNGRFTSVIAFNFNGAKRLRIAQLRQHRYPGSSGASECDWPHPPAR